MEFNAKNQKIVPEGLTIKQVVNFITCTYMRSKNYNHNATFYEGMFMQSNFLNLNK